MSHAVHPCHRPSWRRILQENFSAKLSNGLIPLHPSRWISPYRAYYSQALCLTVSHNAQLVCHCRRTRHYFVANKGLIVRRCHLPSRGGLQGARACEGSRIWETECKRRMSAPGWALECRTNRFRPRYFRTVKEHNAQ